MYPNWPDGLNGFRFRWTAQPGIDLFTGPAIPVRAYLESFWIAIMTKSSANTYPGFQRAVPKLPDRLAGYPDNMDWDKLPFELKWMIPGSDKYLDFGDGPFFGNQYFHVLELSPLADGYLAYVCDGKYDIFRPAVAHPGKYSSIADSPKRTLQEREESAVKLWRIELKINSDGVGSSQPQAGKNPAPINDVFGDWKITGASQDNYWGDLENTTHTPRDPGYVQRRQQCRDAMPQNVDERAQILMSVLDSPPPAEPAVPGWPDNPT